MRNSSCAGEARTPAALAILDRLADVGLGYLVFEGTPADLVGGREGISTLTGEYLAAYVGT